MLWGRSAIFQKGLCWTGLGRALLLSSPRPQAHFPAWIKLRRTDCREKDGCKGSRPVVERKNEKEPRMEWRAKEVYRGRGS